MRKGPGVLTPETRHVHSIPFQVNSMTDYKTNMEYKMCRIYNTVGSLNTLKSHLADSNIHEFKSLREVMQFQSSYPSICQQIISHHENLIEQEKNTLSIELSHLQTAIQTQKQEVEKSLNDKIGSLKQELSALQNNMPTNFFRKIINILKQKSYKRKITQIEQLFDVEIKQSIDGLIYSYQSKQNRYLYIGSNFREAVRQSAESLLYELERKKTRIDGLNSFILGALGEQKVVKTLEALSDDYYLINDFAISFSPALYNKRENDYIKSVQIDHILVAPSGVFLIETKNWSEKSLESLSLRSPVEQIRRTNYALYKLLNTGVSIYRLNLDEHHWGEKQISIRNLIVLTNTKPKEEFQHVKILTLNELLNYVNYFKPIFSNDETKKIAEFLNTVNSQTNI